MLRRLTLTLASLVLALGLSVAVAPTASASCTGHVNCSSGWYSRTVHNSYYDVDLTAAIAVSWFADNHRRIYFSGSEYNGLFHEGMDEDRVVYRVPGGPWVLIGDYSPGPVYGNYTYLDFVPSNAQYPHDFMISQRWAGAWTNTVVIYN